MADALISWSYNASPEELAAQMALGVYDVCVDLLCSGLDMETKFLAAKCLRNCSMCPEAPPPVRRREL